MCGLKIARHKTPDIFISITFAVILLAAATAEPTNTHTTYVYILSYTGHHKIYQSTMRARVSGTLAAF
jgi:hypothetical protein